MNALGFAWRSLVRQPARAALGILGVAAVGALLFDMLMLSDGLVVSMRDLLDRTGFDVRVTATDALPLNGAARFGRASEMTAAVATVPGVRSAIAMRFVDGSIERTDGRPPVGQPADQPVSVTLRGVIGAPPLPWTIVGGRDLTDDASTVISQSLASALQVAPGGDVSLRATCGPESEVLPRVRLRVVGIAEFPFEGASEHSLAVTMPSLDAACGGNGGNEAEVIFVASSGEPERTAAGIRTALPELRAVTNADVVGRFQETGFTYFRQISAVLTTVTLSFALLLITVLLTVSVNQRLGEIAALRAVGFSRSRVVADVLCESALIVGAGGLLSLPMGVALATGLDRILKGIPGLPADMHFFVFEPRTLAWHVVLLTLTAVAAALYPMRIVAGLPIAATLRREVAS